jgi:adenylyltransferase/sulfurtransferase
MSGSWTSSPTGIVTQVEPDPFVRQRALAGFAGEGQSALSRARVAIVGVGGLGCPVAQYLAAAGVGALTLIDSDSVSITNLHRQVLFGPDDVGLRKVDVAASALRSRAPWTAVTAVDARLTDATSGDALAGHDVVVDATDTFASRRIVASAAAANGIPLVWGAVNGWHGQVTVFDASIGLDDVFPEDPPLELDACENASVLGTLCGQVGTAMATEVVKVITGAGAPLVGTLAILDARSGRWREVAVKPAVPVKRPTHA